MQIELRFVSRAIRREGSLSFGDAPRRPPSSVPKSAKALETKLIDKTPWDMTGQVVAIFGCGPGIGLATAEVLCNAGATVACVDIDRDIAEESVRHLADNGCAASAYQANVLDRESVRATYASIVVDHGGVDGVLDVVGRGHIGFTDELTDAEWSEQMDINLRQQFIVAQEAQDHLVATGGSYVAITSINGITSSPTMLAYGVSKAGLISMIRTFALEFGPTGTRYNAIAPGTIRTPRAVKLGLDDGESGAIVRGATPLRRLGNPEEVGYGVLYLMSKLGSFVTGHVLTIDGGTIVNAPLWQEHPSLQGLRR